MLVGRPVDARHRIADSGERHRVADELPSFKRSDFQTGRL